jgi:hypothetical protein
MASTLTGIPSPLFKIKKMEKVKIEREKLAKLLMDVEEILKSYTETSEKDKLLILKIRNNSELIKKEMGEIPTGIDETKWKQIKLF